jgi:hypothetical protein
MAVSEAEHRRVDPVGEVLGEVPLPPYVTVEDAQFAVRAIVVHGPEDWPAGAVCRNDEAPHPCRLHRWGRRVLTRYGLTDAEIDELAARGDPDATVPDRRNGIARFTEQTRRTEEESRA